MIVLDSQAALDGLIDRIADAVAAKLQEGVAPGRQIAMREADAAAAMGLPAHRLKRLRLAGEIRATKAGRSFLYSAAELQRFLARGDP